MKASASIQSLLKVWGSHPSSQWSSPPTGTGAFEGMFRKGFGFGGGLDSGPGPWFWGITYGGINGIIRLIGTDAISSGVGFGVVIMGDKTGVVDSSVLDNIILHDIGLSGMVITIGIFIVNKTLGDVLPILAK